MSRLVKLQTLVNSQSSTINKVNQALGIFTCLVLGPLIMTILLVAHQKDVVEQELTLAMETYFSMDNADTIHGFQRGVDRLTDQVVYGQSGNHAVGWILLTTSSIIHERYFEQSSADFYRLAIHRLKSWELYFYLGAYREAIDSSIGESDTKAAMYQFWNDLEVSEIEAIEECLAVYDEISGRPSTYVWLTLDSMVPGMGSPDCRLHEKVRVRGLSR